MYIPEGYTEAEVLKAIDAVLFNLAQSFTFGYHDIEDMKQEGRIFAIEALASGKFNPKKKIYNFLYSVLRNEFINFKRNKYFRTELPCHSCPFYDKLCIKSKNQCAVFEDKMNCNKYKKWAVRNETKKNLNDVIDIHAINPDGEHNIEYRTDFNDKMFKKEVMQFIDKELPACYRADYLRYISNAKLPKNKVDKLKEVLKEIAKKYFALKDNI